MYVPYKKSRPFISLLLPSVFLFMFFVILFCFADSGYILSDLLIPKSEHLKDDVFLSLNKCRAIRNEKNKQTHI